MRTSAELQARKPSNSMTEQRAVTSAFPTTDLMKRPRRGPSLDVSKTQCRMTRLVPSSSSCHQTRFVCNGCGKKKVGAASFVRCSCCKAVYYCNKACQIMDWKADGVATRYLSHQECCLEFCDDQKEFLEDPNGMIVRPKLFPWAEQNRSSGVFFLEDCLKRKGLRAGNQGFWARPNTLSPQHLEDDDRNGWCHGQILLQETLPSIHDGWSVLNTREIPSGPAVSKHIHSWAEYAKRRNLSRSSIAPFLLTDVLTTYHMIMNELELHRHKPRNGNHFVVCVLGAASELNYLQLFEELAFLLPTGMDVELRFVSPAVRHLMNKAFWSYSDSYLMTCRDYVVNKTVPNGGRVRVSLERQHSLLHRVKFRSIPDAAIALNVDLGSSDDWSKTFVKLIARETPFSISEQTKHSLRFVSILDSTIQ